MRAHGIVFVHHSKPTLTLTQTSKKRPSRCIDNRAEIVICKHPWQSKETLHVGSRFCVVLSPKGPSQYTRNGSTQLWNSCEAHYTPPFQGHGICGVKLIAIVSATIRKLSKDQGTCLQRPSPPQYPGCPSPRRCPLGSRLAHR